MPLRSDTFDVLLTDVQMPAINGFDLLKLLPCVEPAPSADHSRDSRYRP